MLFERNVLNKPVNIRRTLMCPAPSLSLFLLCVLYLLSMLYLIFDTFSCYIFYFAWGILCLDGQVFLWPLHLCLIFRTQLGKLRYRVYCTVLVNGELSYFLHIFRKQGIIHVPVRTAQTARYSVSCTCLVNGEVFILPCVSQL